MLRLCITLCALVTLTSGLRVERDDLWTSFKVRHNKTYDSWNDVIRRSIWEYNLDQIERHNIEESRGLHSYTIGENHFSDMTHEELRKLMPKSHMMTNHSKPHTKLFKHSAKSVMPPTTNVSETSLPSTVDWREKGILTPVKNQGHCGSCWAFAATGALEAQWAKKTGMLVGLSEQNLVDCSWGYGNKGCDGGVPDFAFDYIKDNGINTEASYPYTGQENACQYNKAWVGATMSEYWYYDPPATEADLAKKVAEVGPVSAAIDARDSLYHYRGGVYRNSQCSNTELNHAVLVVGYGTGVEGDYWLVKNSWGADWGEKGYFRMARNADNMCGIAAQISFPEV